MKIRALALAFLVAAPLAACANDAPSTGSSAAFSTQIAEGFHSINSDAKYWDLAVGEKRAYLLNGALGSNELDVVDLSSMDVIGQIAAIDDLPPLPASEQDGTQFKSDLELRGVQILPDQQVVVFGRRNDADPIDPTDILFQDLPWQYSFVVQGLSADGSTAEWSLGLDLRGALAGASGFVDKENMSAFVTEDAIAMTFSHKDAEPMVFTVPRPEDGEHEMFQLVEHPSIGLPAAPLTRLEGVGDHPRFITASGDGAYLVSSSDGLFRVHKDAADMLAPSLADDAWLREIRVVDGLALVEDYGTGLQVVSVQSGELLETVELDYYPQGLDATDQQVMIGSQTGLEAIDIAWDAGDGPVDDGDDDGSTDGGSDDGGSDDDDDGATCGFGWWPNPAGWGMYWGWGCG